MSMHQDRSGTIQLSETISMLFASLQKVPKKRTPDEFTRLTVSQTVSLVAILYEKLRTVLEVKEDHLILRSAIERILKRKMSMNPSGKGESEHLLRELMWARYIPNGSVDEGDILSVQHVIDSYHGFNATLKQKTARLGNGIGSLLFEMMTCEIGEVVAPESAQREMLFSYVVFQTLREKISHYQPEKEYTDALLFLTIETMFRRSDGPYQRYHLFTLIHKPLADFRDGEKEDLAEHFNTTYRFIEMVRSHKKRDVIEKYVRKQLPPFLILFSVIRARGEKALNVCTDKNKLWEEVKKDCNAQYVSARKRIFGLAMRTSLYLLLVRLSVAFIIEYPFYSYLYGFSEFIPVLASILFYPIILWVLVLTFSVPGNSNTKRIYLRIIDILDSDPSYEKRVGLDVHRYSSAKQYEFLFVLAYVVLFMLTFGGLVAFLTFTGFHILSQAISILFVCFVLYIAYRIRQVAHQYRFRESDGIISPFLYMFVVPYITFGRSLAQFFASINLSFITNAVDLIIETPFKLIIEVFEEWSSFIRAKKEDVM